MRHLYHTRAAVLRLSMDMHNGVPSQSWDQVDDIIDPLLGVPGEIMCRIDLAYQRPGKDQPMPVAAGRAPDRIGLLFLDNTDLVHAGDRIQALHGPVQGIFEIRVMPDVAAGYSLAHHLEVQIVEVAQNMRPNLLDHVGTSSP